MNIRFRCIYEHITTYVNEYITTHVNEHITTCVNEILQLALRHIRCSNFLFNTFQLWWKCLRVGLSVCLFLHVICALTLINILELRCDFYVLLRLTIAGTSVTEHKVLAFIFRLQGQPLQNNSITLLSLRKTVSDAF